MDFILSYFIYFILQTYVRLAVNKSQSGTLLPTVSQNRETKAFLSEYICPALYINIYYVYNI